MPIAARSAPNNGRVKEAKVSSCTRGTGKALNGNRQAKRKDENKNIKGEIRKGRREDKFGDKDKATIENKNKDKRGDNIRVERSITLGYGR